MKKLTVNLFSFGYHFSGCPIDTSGNQGGFEFDCRCLPNPGIEPQFAELTGKDKHVIEYLKNSPDVNKFMSHVYGIIDVTIFNYMKKDYASLMVSFGCTGGQHRSVYCAEQLLSYLKSKPIEVHLIHLELD